MREDLPWNAASVGYPQKTLRKELSDLPIVGQVRDGLMAPVECVPDLYKKKGFAPSWKIGARVFPPPLTMIKGQ